MIGYFIGLGGMWLEQLSLSFKQCFKFLNTSCLCCQDSFVSFIRDSNQIAKSIIGWDAIQMMDNPTFGYLAMCLFPYKNVLSDISMIISFRVIGIFKQTITIAIMSYSSSPRVVFLSPWYHGSVQYTNLPRMFHSTTFTACGTSKYFLATTYAVIRWCLCSFAIRLIFSCTRMTSERTWANRLATINTWMLLPPMLSHILIIAEEHYNHKQRGLNW